MSALKRHLASTALCLAFTGGALPVCAGSVTYSEIRGSDIAPVAIRDMLDKSLVYNAAGFDGWFLDATQGRWVIRKDFDLVKKKFFSATFAEFEYTFVRHGVSETRVYHAVSGYDFAHYMRRPLTPPTSPPGHVPTAEEKAVLESLRDVDSQVRGTVLPASTDGWPAVGWSETRPYDDYFASSTVQKRTRILDSDVSTIQPRNDLATDDLPHDWDAELKAVRTIERDILAGEVTPNGMLRVAVSKPLCNSCINAISQFTDLYDVTAHVTSFEVGSDAARLFKASRTNVMNSIWGHAIRRQTRGLLPGEAESFAEELGEDALRACGPG